MWRRPSRPAGSPPTRCGTSTRPASSSSADPTATAVLPAARSSSTPTAARRPHGGGAFSGKDPTKVDRSAAYAARYLAKNVIAADLADRCTLQLSYAIGVARPLSIYADLHGTGRIDESKLEKALIEVMNLTPRGIREHLQLNRPIFARTSAFGHFGRAPDADGGFSWERTDLADTLRRLA